MSQIRLCFAGTPAFAADHLSCLIDNRWQIAAVYTRPDRPSGRGRKIRASAVKQLAGLHSLPVFQPSSLRTQEARDELRNLAPDLLIVVAYGLILPQEILDIPKYGCINVHASGLPRWRGAAPIERALLAGDKESGVTIMQMDAGLDTGPMLYTRTVEILGTDDRESLTEKLSAAGRKALLYTLDNLQELRASALPQNDVLSTCAGKLDKHEFKIDWSQPASQINNVIRAGIGRFPAFTFLDGARIRILKASPDSRDYSETPGTIVSVDRNRFIINCGASALAVTDLQLPGKTPVTVSDLLNSKPQLIAVGKAFDNTETA